ncbi:MAG: FAD-dependent oxidoreductase [Acutalibacteraceae bacterium]
MDKIIKSDLTVVGGGISGICVAISAARNGVKVSLINDRDIFGGNASSEYRIHIDGGAWGNSTFYSREAGIADEIKLYILKKNPCYNIKQECHLSDMAILELLLNEKNIKLFSGTSVYDCECEDNKVIRAFGIKNKSQEKFVFESPYFCDASGDGILAYNAGAEYRVGREAKEEFNESLAPEKADSHVMGSCILFNVRDEGKPVKYEKPDFAYDFVKDGIINYFNRPETGRELPKPGENYGGPWWLEYGGMIDTIADSDDIDFELKKIIYSYWDYIKNSGKYPDSENLSIDWIAPSAAKRESRRFMGKYIMKQSDIEDSKYFEDAVSTGGWSLDIHDVGGIYGNEKTSAFGNVSSLYNIPFSIMYSKDISNLFLAGRIISCTHVALGSLRVMQTLGAMGQAVGTAASLCKKYNATPDEIDQNHIQELRSILQKDGQFIIGFKEDCGLAADAEITASSTKSFENPNSTSDVLLNESLYFTIPCKSAESIKIKIKNNSDSIQTLSYQIFAQKDIKNYLLGDLLCEKEVKIEPNFDGFIALPIGIKPNGKFFVNLEKNNNISVYVSDEKVAGAPTIFGNNFSKSKEQNTFTICFKDIETKEEIYSPQNVVNGYSRPYDSANCWVSKGKENQWLELEFDSPKKISEISIYFNSQFETEHFDNPIVSLITDYKITVFGDKTESKTVSNNFNGQNKIKFEAENVQKIRFDFLKNNGAENFEVFAVKVF